MRNIQMQDDRFQKPATLKAILSSLRVAPHKGKAIEIFRNYDAQIGEFGWHAIHVDETIDTMSEHHAASMIDIINRAGIKAPRILEMGAYAHYSSQIVAHRTGGSSVSHDISAASLIEGQKRAQIHGYGANNTSVAGDFHDLPFADNAFDIVFIASAVHHTRRPWEVLREMVRVTRPGGVIHLENEPVGRIASFYQFRGNRDGERTPFEDEIERLGLTWTVSSPFPGTRAEELFGMVENDRIPMDVYEDNLLAAGKVLHWSLDSAGVMGPFEAWLLTRPDTTKIAERLLSDLESAAALFSERDSASGFSIPTPDQIWALAYAISNALKTTSQSDVNATQSKALLFGAALKASIIKSGSGSCGQMMRRHLREVDGVLIDDDAIINLGIKLENILPAPQDGYFGGDWTAILEGNGYHTLVNNGAINAFEMAVESDGVLVLRTYSVAKEEPYFFSVVVGDSLAYRHCVTASESHLAKVYVAKGQPVFICHHDKIGEPVEANMHARVIPKLIPVS